MGKSKEGCCSIQGTSQAWGSGLCSGELEVRDMGLVRARARP